jgi:uncharacterized membrane protein
MNVARYLLIWAIAFVVISALDAFWHLGLFGRLYSERLRPVARLADGRLAMRAMPGLLSQVLVITAYLVLVFYQRPAGLTYGAAALIGATGGVLAISVYGLVNDALIRDWDRLLTVLEVIWGPIIGALSGLLIAWLRQLLS